jgi:hypothetical protein
LGGRDAVITGTVAAKGICTRWELSAGFGDLRAYQANGRVEPYVRWAEPWNIAYYKEKQSHRSTGIPLAKMAPAVVDFRSLTKADRRYPIFVPGWTTSILSSLTPG